MKKIILILFIAGAVGAQSKLTGKLYLDSGISFKETSVEFDDYVVSAQKKKAPFTAALLSFAVPGAGQFYSESYLKSALFVAVEAAAITVGLIYDKKGDDQTIRFQNFADEHWDVARYARWTIVHANEINPSIDPSNYFVFNPDGTVNWKELNKLENALGGYYSHRLAPYGDQQYYEMIGKYPQFNVGWDDFGDENTPYKYGDPLTENFIFYSKERGKANDFYNVAYKAVLVIFTNHIISAIDAALTAHSFNKNIKVNAELNKINVGYRTFYYPQLNLQYNF
ncbi:hypothetical protein MROS_1892 [Melioribacter roseus P3M-2]|uniref:DUF5683 domain-containing protein n=1 Tax=Melioribacter roseus (strain DSM 23840 / JCM 17771 / VKM B-2668 / P3M-2) TaxID=1191523 RepID=I6ZSV5_MELRP|nr:hypothetical protein [Melioribacter roseus]AFN75124.1 hypothetical protein MROS_1892 [Melioribacter roseus P3M-2]